MNVIRSIVYKWHLVFYLDFISTANSRLSVSALQRRHRSFQQDSSQFVYRQLDPELFIAFNKQMKFGFLARTWFDARWVEDTYSQRKVSKYKHRACDHDNLPLFVMEAPDKSCNNTICSLLVAFHLAFCG